jgi:integrase
MTSLLQAALRSHPVIRNGFVVRNADGSSKRDQACRSAIERIYKRAGVAYGEPNSQWHRLRHTFATHAAMLGVNPWALMTWMGHKSMSQTLGYVELAHAHHRPTPEHVLAAANGEQDPDRKVILMLGGRGKSVAKTGSTVEAVG